MASNPSAVLQPITSQDDAEQAELLAAAVSQNPVGDRYRFGRATFGDTITRAVPRLLWPDKPKPPREDVISRFWPAEYRSGAANPEFSVMLALWLGLRWPGVLIGLFVLGLGSRLALSFE